MENTTKASEYRQRAVRCREQATVANNPQSKEYWLRTAEDWLKMAENAERVQKSK